MRSNKYNIFRFNIIVLQAIFSRIIILTQKPSILIFLLPSDKAKIYITLDIPNNFRPLPLYCTVHILSTQRQEWHFTERITGIPHTAFSVFSKSSCCDILAKSATLSCGRNWQRFPTCMFLFKTASSI